MAGWPGGVVIPRRARPRTYFFLEHILVGGLLLGELRFFYFWQRYFIFFPSRIFRPLVNIFISYEISSTTFWVRAQEGRQLMSGYALTVQAWTGTAG